MADRDADDLIASYYTLSGAPPWKRSPYTLEARAAAAAAAGFVGIGFVPLEFKALREEGWSDDDFLGALSKHDMRIPELEFLTGWHQESAATREYEETLYEMADLFGVRHINIGLLEPTGTIDDIDALAPPLAAICDRAAAHDVLIAYEFFPWVDVDDITKAWQVVRLADRPNAGILLDTWHYFRGAADPDALKQVPADRIFTVQINDADAEQIGSLDNDSTRYRRLPGEGVFDLVGFIRLIDEMGVTAPISVELIADAQRELPLTEAAQRAMDTTRAVLQAARG